MRTPTAVSTLLCTLLAALLVVASTAAGLCQLRCADQAYQWGHSREQVSHCATMGMVAADAHQHTIGAGHGCGVMGSTDLVTARVPSAEQKIALTASPSTQALEQGSERTLARCASYRLHESSPPRPLFANLRI
jgi:hypothetical protein